MTYANAFNCNDCPGNNDTRGCPLWLKDMIETLPQTGEQRVLSGCLLPHLPRFIILMIQACNRPAAAVEQMRNDIVETIVNGIQYTASLGVAAGAKSRGFREVGSSGEVGVRQLETTDP